MGKINKEKLVSGLKVGIIGLGLIFGVFIILFVVPSIVIKNEKILDVYIPSVILIILLVPVLLVFYYSYIAYKNNKPQFIDGKYVWKDGRVYEGEWKNNQANGKGKLAWADGSYYEGEFKNGKHCGKGKKVLPNLERYEGEWENNQANGKGKSIGVDGSYYEGEFKNGKPHGMGIIKMKNGYYYEGEFSDGKRTGRFKKEVLPGGGVLEGEFIYGSDGFNGVGKEILPNGFISEGTFRDGNLNGEGRTTFPDGTVYIGNYENGLFNGTGKKILQNGEYFEGIWVKGELSYATRHYFSDGSYYEGEFKDGDWSGKGTYVTKKGDKYSTEFPYEIINVFMYGLNSKIKEIQGNLNYISKTEKEKQEEKNMYLEILEKGTDIQKEIAKLSLEEDEKSEKLLNSLKMDNSVENLLNFYKSSIKFIEKDENKVRNIANKYHIKFSKKKALSCSYSQFFFRLDGCCINEIVGGEAFIKILQFLSSKNILDFVTKREEKNKEWVYLIDEFSKKYKEYIQNCLDWREYEKKFWNHNFKPKKDKK